VHTECNRRIEELTAENAALRALVAQLQARLEELERRLGQNSSNSSRPPSSDSPAGREARSGKPPSGRRRGAQPGHKGWRRQLLPPERVNEARDCFPKRCRRRGCGKQLPHRPDPNPLPHQVVEIPRIEPHVTEYRLHSVTCDCGKVTRASLPPGVPRGMCGPRLAATIALLTGDTNTSRRDAVRLLSDILGVQISLGALSETEDMVSEALAVPVEEVGAHVSEQGIKHVDATGYQQAGQKRTLWTIAAPLVTFFAITGNASSAGLRGLFRTIKGIFISDRGCQFGFWAMKDRQICWAHLIRKFVSFAERSGVAGELGANLLLLSRTMMHVWHQVRDGTLSRCKFREFIANLRPVFEGHLERGVGLDIRGVSGSCADILAHRLALWTFVEQEDVEPTNNAAERALRAFVLWRKMSFGSQSERGTRFAARIQTVVQTLRKQRRHVLSYLTEACQAALTGAPPPSLLPPLAAP
jgi:transposase